MNQKENKKRWKLYKSKTFYHWNICVLTQVQAQPWVAPWEIADLLFIPVTMLNASQRLLHAASLQS